ncbi:MAG: FAD-dependent oxidoreductase [Candidatus Electrothrix sp. GW3-4]|uniref:NAD(P)/FAD-dependent oxidoreductase n=1 Tax=Candidatus Electrothrix sp. GW3-4 TaxID=3126740 RepID=UPI0030CA8609
MMRYVIVGGSIAATTALNVIRANRLDAEIQVVADEARPFYYRALIPFLLDNSRSVEELLFTEQPTDDERVQFRHDRCIGVDPQQGAIGLASGGTLPYDRLLLAAGSSSLTPDIAGVDSKGVFSLRDLDEALKVRAYLKGCKNAVVIGGALAGIKMAEALQRTALQVAVVEQRRHILPHIADTETAQRIGQRLGQEGMEILTSDSAAEILASDGKVTGVRLSSGKTVPADLVLLMTGVQPNIEFLAGSGIALDQAVLTDQEMQTSVPDIYAAGDMVQIHDPVMGKDVVSALWGNAVHMGRTAGFNMSGIKALAPPLLSSFNSTEIAGLPIISAGLLHTQSEQYAVYAEAQDENYRKLIFAQDRLVGMIFLGKVNRAGVYTNLIRNRIPLGDRRDALIREVMGEIA